MHWQVVKIQFCPQRRTHEASIESAETYSASRIKEGSYSRRRGVACFLRPYCTTFRKRLQNAVFLGVWLSGFGKPATIWRDYFTIFPRACKTRNFFYLSFSLPLQGARRLSFFVPLLYHIEKRLKNTDFFTYGGT